MFHYSSIITHWCLVVVQEVSMNYLPHLHTLIQRGSLAKKLFITPSVIN